jgi:hypothetical protein
MFLRDVWRNDAQRNLIRQIGGVSTLSLTKWRIVKLVGFLGKRRSGYGFRH